MPVAPARLRFSLRTFLWLALVAPLVVFALREHYERTRLAAQLEAIELKTRNIQQTRAAELASYRTLADRQAQLIHRYRLRQFQP
jgi:hypothetical protein